MADLGAVKERPSQTVSALKAKPAPVRAEKAAADTPKARVDFATVGGLLLAFSGILGGLILEGGKIQDVAQITAAMIVFGGTIGAVLVTMPLPVVVRAARQIASIFVNTAPNPGKTIDQIIEFATMARRHGIVSLEKETAGIEDRFLRKALELAVDGIDMDQIRVIMELEISTLEHTGDEEAKVFEAAGGYSPTIGIIGAVLGLIQVMKNLANIDEVGRGIAVAFVATVYGVAAANLFFLPASGKLRARVREAVRTRELMLEGVLGIAEGLNQKLIRAKLEAYVQHTTAAPKVKKAAGIEGSRVTKPLVTES